MPYKANQARRHKIPKARYRVTNWPEYDRALQQRGSLTVWVTPEALAAWHPPKTGRRGRSLAEAQRTGPVHVVIDSTGLQVHGAGAWLAETHGGPGRRSWRKLHLAVDPNSGEILASELTTSEEGDPALGRPLLARITGPIASVIADG